jgi:outer membrane biosynthesis protein TonB
MMKPTVSTFFVSFLLTLGLAGCDTGTDETAGVGEEEGLYQEETEVERERAYEEPGQPEVVEQPGIRTEEERGITQEEEDADVTIVEEGEQLDLPEESPAAGQEQQQPQQQQQRPQQ